MSKSEYYTAKSDLDEFDSIGDKLAADLRRSIRHLDNYPVLSDPWIDMAEVFGRVAHISEVESALPSTKKDATLWETEEQALRFLMEDGKLNLCLRILIEFKIRQIDSRKEGRGPMIDFSAECDKFEKGLGVIMRNAWQHVEVLQTTDLPALINYIADVLEANLALVPTVENLFRETDVYQRQEVLVFHYLYHIVRQVEEIRESRLMPYLRERKIFTTAVRVLNTFGKSMVKTHQLIAVESLAFIVDTEDFATNPRDYIMAEDLELLLEFKETILQELMQDMEKRKVIRPLVDAIDKAKRQLSKK